MTSEPGPPGRDLSGFDATAELAEVSAATERLLSTVEGLDSAAAVQPSRLPGWTRAHVLGHLARNADALGNLLAWARTGERTPMYASTESRAADIEAAAAQALPDLMRDLRSSAVAFATAVAEMPAEAWERRVRLGADAAGAEIRASRVLWQRLKELEIHHIDLDAGYTTAHWSPAFVERATAETLRMFDRREDAPPFTVVATDDGSSTTVHGGGSVVTGPRTALLGWLTGRSAGDGLQVDPPGALPSLPAWA